MMGGRDVCAHHVTKLVARMSLRGLGFAAANFVYWINCTCLLDTIFYI